MNHQQLIDALVEARLSMNFIVFAEIGIGSRWLQNNNLPVPDVMTLRYSYTRPDVTIYEIKSSRQDFLQEMNQAKYKRYLSFCDRFYFASPLGLLKKTEIPDDAGLIVYNQEKGWSVVKASPRHTADLDRIDWQSLMMAKYATEKKVRRLKERIVWEENASLVDKVTGLSSEVRLKIYKVEGIEERIKAIKETIAEGLGIEPEELYKRESWGLKSFLKETIRNLTISKEKELIMKITAKLSEAFCDGISSWENETFIKELRELAEILEKKKCKKHL